MTNEELLTDLKQFIATTVSQQTSQLESRLDVVEANMATKDDIKSVREDLHNVQNAIADALTQATEATDATLQDHERRLRRLEHRAA